MPQICFNCQMGATLVDTFAHLKKKKALNSDTPQQTAQATVCSRRVDSIRSITKTASSWIYLATFQLQDGTSVELQVEETQFPTLLEGLPVEITWKDQQLLEFKCL